MSTRIIVKKARAHAGHHGGAWKVAYADFVTAMMALFIVLWLLNSNKQVQEAIGGYFKDPTGSSKKVGSDMRGSGDYFAITKDDMPKLKEQLTKALRKVPNFEKLSKQIEMTVTAEGLRIELIEEANGTFFDLGSAEPSLSGQELLTALAKEIGKLPNKVSIEGHTDSKPYMGDLYSNWELSVDRANTARRIMQNAALSGKQLLQVRGLADQHLRLPAKPDDPSNRRISVIVHYVELQDQPKDAAAHAQTAQAASH
ncbi:MAG TPA: flagellar motor protein MotB [Terriglobales bacterium]|nr:flagellar motor protein MotB [Terriglobales bacterium]